MKKNLYFLMTVAAMASVSCVNDENGMDQTPSEAVTITATAENDADSKTSLSSGKVLWHNADAVTVWNGTQAGEFTTADPDGSESVLFVASSLEYAAADEYLAVYPHSAAAVFADGKVTAQVKAVQDAYADGFAKGVNVAVAAGTGENLTFRNVCGYVKFTVPAGMTDLTKVEFKANSGEILAGNVNVTIADGPSAEVVSDGVSAVSLEGSFEAGKSYYIAVLPKTLQGGFTMTLTRGEETTEMSTTKPFTVTRSKAIPVGELYDGTWQVRLEGTAVPEGQTMKLTQTLENENLFACLETLNAGTLNLKVLYENVYVTTAGGTYTDGAETEFTTAAEACNFDILSAGLYRIVLNKATGKLIIYSPATNPKNTVVTYSYTVPKPAVEYTQEVTSLWMYGTFNGLVQDKSNCPLGQTSCQFDCKYRLTQSLANPYLFVYYNAEKDLPRLEKVFQTWDNVKYKGGVNFYVSNIQNNVWAYGSNAEAERQKKTGAVECILSEQCGAVAGQSHNRYALFLIPEGANYVEVDIQNLKVLFDRR